MPVSTVERESHNVMVLAVCLGWDEQFFWAVPGVACRTTGVQPIARWSMLGIVHNPSNLHIEPRQGGKANLTNTFLWTCTLTHCLILSPNMEFDQSIHSQ